jgi:hypothetical protein
MLDANTSCLTDGALAASVRINETIGRDTMTLASDRIRIERAGQILGLATRTVQKMSQRGELPGAARMGRRWTYNEEKLHGYVRNKERETCQQSQKRIQHRPGAIGKTEFCTTGLRSTANDSEDRYSQTILAAQRNSARLRKKN